MSNQMENSNVVTVVAYYGQGDKSKEISYTDTKFIGKGSFGDVFQAKLCETNEIVAVKKVLQDRRFKNRELQIMRQLDHPNVVQLKYYFHLVGERKDEVYLNLVLEFVPETVYRMARRCYRTKDTLPMIHVKLYMYQLLRSLAYIHHNGICHRDIKPQNLLLNPTTAVLKLCDFGSAKVLVRGEPNVSYICSRYYRAPELIFGAVEYTCQIDIWSSGCVLAELLLGQPIFPGDSGVDQLVEIIKVLGTPTRDQIHEMNPDYREFRFPSIKALSWPKVFRPRVPSSAVQLVSQLLEYTPSRRLTPMQALLHNFFDELRQEDTRLPNNRPLPPLFNFTPYELSMSPDITKLLSAGRSQSRGAQVNSSGESGTSAAAEAVSKPPTATANPSEETADRSPVLMSPASTSEAVDGDVATADHQSADPTVPSAGADDGEVKPMAEAVTTTSINSNSCEEAVVESSSSRNHPSGEPVSKQVAASGTTPPATDPSPGSQDNK